MIAATAFHPAVETHLLRSNHVAQTFRIQVAQPPLRRGEATRFPVVYVTDANLGFDMLKGIVAVMHGMPEEWTRFILVGIGYPGDSPEAGKWLRVRDLTFPGYPVFHLGVPPIEGVLASAPEQPDHHGAEAFQQFIEHELFPFIDDRYVTIPSTRTYFGHSAGAGFGLFTLFERSHLFSNYIISSPGVAYHGTSSAGIVYNNHEFLLERAARFSSAMTTLHDVRLYLSVGTREEFEPALHEWRLTSTVLRLAHMIESAAIPGLHIRTELLNGETHMSAWPVAFMHGMRELFARTAP